MYNESVLTPVSNGQFCRSVSKIFSVKQQVVLRMPTAICSHVVLMMLSPLYSTISCLVQYMPSAMQQNCCQLAHAVYAISGETNLLKNK